MDKAISVLIDSFVSGLDHSVSTANRLESALDEGWGENPAVQEVVEMLVELELEDELSQLLTRSTPSDATRD